MTYLRSHGQEGPKPGLEPKSAHSTGHALNEDAALKDGFLCEPLGRGEALGVGGKAECVGKSRAQS